MTRQKHIIHNKQTTNGITDHNNMHAATKNVEHLANNSTVFAHNH